MYTRRRDSGFTLIEIIAVVIILGVLAAVAVPKFFDIQEESDRKAAAAAVAEAQARINLRFGQLMFQGAICEEATKEVSNIEKLSDNQNSAFGEFILGTGQGAGGTVLPAGSRIYAARSGSKTFQDTETSLFLPGCYGVETLASTIPTQITGYLDTVIQTNSHDFRKDIVGVSTDIGNGVSFEVTGIVNQYANGAYVDYKYTNNQGNTLLFQVRKDKEGKTWIQQMIVSIPGKPSINLVKDNYRPNLKDADVDQARNIVESMGLNPSTFETAFKKDLGKGILYTDGTFKPL